jgi:hypothetical protein
MLRLYEWKRRNCESSYFSNIYKTISSIQMAP